jgi:hypothetical protein
LISEPVAHFSKASLSFFLLPVKYSQVTGSGPLEGMVIDRSQHNFNGSVLFTISIPAVKKQ